MLDKAKKNIAKLDIKKVNFKLGNGLEESWEEEIFDAIIVCASYKTLSDNLLKTLKCNGRLIMPKQYPSGNQKLLLVTKKNKNHFDQMELLNVKFVPLLNKDSVK